MSGAVKKAEPGVKQHGIRACTQSRWPSVEKKNEEGGFSWFGQIRNRQRWVKEWNAQRWLWIERERVVRFLKAVGGRYAPEVDKARPVR